MKKLTQILLVLLALTAARTFSGTNQSYTVNNINFGNDVFTMCFWVKTATWQDEAVIVGYGNGNDSGSGRGFTLRTWTDGTIRVDYYSAGTNENDRNTSGAMSTGAWHHFCYRRGGLFDNDWFVDGTEVKSNGGYDYSTKPNSTDDMVIGETIPQEGGIDFNGDLAHVAYWAGTKLSDANIVSLADKSTCPTSISASTLEVFLPLGSNAVADQSGNAFTVTANGTPTASTGPVGLPCDDSAAANNFPELQAIGED